MIKQTPPQGKCLYKEINGVRTFGDEQGVFMPEGTELWIECSIEERLQYEKEMKSREAEELRKFQEQLNID